MGPQTYIDTLPGSRGSNGTTLALRGVEQVQHGRRRYRPTTAAPAPVLPVEGGRPTSGQLREAPTGWLARRPTRQAGRYLWPMGEANVPDKPSLDGLEAKWGARWEADGTYRFDRTKTRDEIYSIDTPPPTVSRLAPRGPRLQLHPHRHDRPLPAHAGREVFYPMGWDDNGAAHRAPGPELLRRPLRPDAPLRPRLRRRPTKPGKQHAARSHAATSSSCAAAHRRGREGLRGSCGAELGPVGRLGAHLRHHRRQRPARRPAGLPAQPAPAARPTSPRRRRCGTSTSAPPSPRPSSRTASEPGAYHRIAFRAPAEPDVFDRDDPARAARRLRRPRRPPRRRALPAAVRPDGHDAAVRRRGPGRRPPAGRSREGLGHRHDLHLRRHHRRHLVARAATCRDPGHRRARRPAPS